MINHQQTEISLREKGVDLSSFSQEKFLAKLLAMHGGDHHIHILSDHVYIA